MPEKRGRVLKGRGEPKGFPRGREETGSGEQRETWRSLWKVTWALDCRSRPKGQREVSLGALGSFPGPMGRGHQAILYSWNPAGASPLLTCR